jgi:hypothetical protein
MSDLQVQYLAIDDLATYGNNSRTHSDAQILQIQKSIKEFGFTNPLLITKDNSIIAGHGRLAAAKELGLKSVPTIVLSNLTKKQQQAYVIADNQLALNAGWDLDILKLEMESLINLDFNVDVLGFDDTFLDELMPKNLLDDAGGGENPYTMTIEAPTYEPSDEKPPVSALISLEKTSQLIEKIQASSVSEDEKKFLLLAAERHTVFDFSKIANYYAHSNEEMQALMEDSALVIIDYNKALQDGFVQINKEMVNQFEEDSLGQQDEG